MELGFLSYLKGSKATTRNVVSAITQAVDSGQLVEGDKMPSAREIGMYVGASRTIIVRAFDELVARGYLMSRRGYGTVVGSAGIVPDLTPQDVRESNFIWRDHYSESARSLIERHSQLTTSADFEELNNGCLPAEFLPSRMWQKSVAEHCTNGMQFDPISRKEIFGYRPLREAIARFLRRTRGILCDPDQIVLYSGAQAALAHLAELLVRPNQIVVCENPGYAVAREQFLVRGANVVPAQIDSEGMIIETLHAMQEPAHWLYLTPSCQDPTGAVLSEERRERLLEWSSINRTAIIEDAWDADFDYCGRSLPTLFSMDKNGSVVHLYTFWRLLSPLCSTAFLLLPEKLVPLFKNSKYLNDRQFPSIDHLVLTDILEKGQFEKHLYSVWKHLKARRQSLIYELKRNLTQDVSVVAQGAGMHVVVRFNRDWSKSDIQEAAKFAGLPLVSTEPYYFHEPRQNEFMVFFASIPADRSAQIVTEFAARLPS